ncbi:MAG: thiamine phosphate synthase [Gemmatimonadota bacterium]|nr:thiamine phosphate synthase [Gemmatimonadota bacterium]
MTEGEPVGAPSVPIVHAVTDDLILAQPWFLEQARAVMVALRDRGAVHLRARSLPAARLYEIAVALHPVQEATGCWIVCNDRLDVALAAGARGVQLTSRSMSVADARKVAPLLALGASVHARGEAQVAERDGGNWVVAGNVFPTRSHVGAPGKGLLFLRGVAASTRLPCIGIGGIRPEQVGLMRAVGARGVAVISGIWGAEDADRAAIEYLSSYDAHGDPG